MEAAKQRHRAELREMAARQQAEVAAIPKKDRKARKKAAKLHREEEEAARKAHWEELARINEEATGGEDEEEEEEEEEEGEEEENAAARAEARARQEAEEERRRGEEKRAKAARKKAEKAERKRQREEERRAEAERGADAMEDLKRMESEALATSLAAMGLRVREVEADGHCLYRAVDDQLGEDARGVDGLRAEAARYIRSHPDDFLPFLDEDGTGALDDSAFQRYCDGITAAQPVVWGGHPEIVALASSLGRTVVVHSADARQPLTVEPAGAGGRGGDTPLHLSYHKHAFGLGEHYNSVVPLE